MACGGRSRAGMMLCWVLASAGSPVRAQNSAGPLVILHAASLSGPLAEIEAEFRKMRPGLEIEREPSATAIAARKVTDLRREADILIAADDDTIPSMLEPRYAGFSARFMREKMAVLYTDRSKFAAEVSSSNWHEILLRPGVEFGISDPGVAPVGYRALLVWKLAERHYRRPGLYKELSKALPQKNIRQDAAALLALLKAGELDYIFDYDSLSLQEGIRAVELPPEVNLGEPDLDRRYRRVQVEVAGQAPGRTRKIHGGAIVFSLTILANAPHREAAEAFVKFLLGPEGRKILARNKRPPIAPARVDHTDKLPEGLRELVTGA